MKKSVAQLFDFFWNHQYGKLILGLLLGALVIAGALLVHSLRQAAPIALSQVAAAISAGQVVRIVDSLESGKLAIHYQDGSRQTSRRDPAAPFLEQMRYLAVTDSQLTQLRYEVADASVLTAERGTFLLLTVTILSLVGFAIVRQTGGSALTTRKKYVEGEIPNTTFKDVAGADESREELVDIVAFLKDNAHYERLGAHMPRGVLLVGDPGTGKTLLARAVAGEAGVPFFSTSGSEFVEMFVGVGASRVRALFKKARAKAPCIVFIDEIDAVGRKRHSNGGGGGEMEQDQTLNQLLVEMDGFSPSEGVVVLAATNRTDVLDSALTRAGRFDRHVTISRPDVNGRRAILDVHVKGRPFAPDVNLLDLAKSTPGLVGADLANIINEAAILAVRAKRDCITVRDCQEAVEKALIGGVQSKSRVIAPNEKRTIAYHEVGHAIVMHANPHSDPVYKISIISRGQMGGFTMALPEEETMLMSRNQLLARITGLMGGRVAEELFCDDITSGAANDLQVATQLAEEMVMRLGMSATGLRVFERPEGYAALGSRSGQKTYDTLDEEIARILSQGYVEAKRLLSEQRDAVERVTECLLEQETLSREEFVALVMNHPSAPEAASRQKIHADQISSALIITSPKTEYSAGLSA
ncbi:MAG: ATP-dependent zinc metalloprotease FtsH [Azonexus sp.]